MCDTVLFYETAKQSGYRLSYIAEQIGLTVQGLRKKATNQTDFTASEIDKLAKLFGKTIEELKPIFFAQHVVLKATDE